MSIEGLLVSLVVVVIVGLWIAAPLLRRETAQSVADLKRQQSTERWQIYYERTLRNIRDLDEDHTMGKINTEDYELDRELWVQRGMAALQRLDELDDTLDESATDEAIDDSIESAVAAYREGVPG
jgi:hypothetical protein